MRLSAFLLLAAGMFAGRPAQTSAPYQDKCLAILVKAADVYLKLQMPDGRLCGSIEDQKKGPDDYIYFLTGLKEDYVRPQHFILACAVLYTFNGKKNPYYRKKELLDAIVRAARFSGAAVAKYAYMEHRFALSHSEAYRLMLPYLGKDDKTAWKMALMEWGGFIAQQVAAVKNPGRYTTAETGVNLNHFAYYNLALLRLGRLFGNAAWTETGTRHLKGIVAVQHPDGFWDEWNGPTPSYNYVTVHAVAAYHALIGDPEALKSLARATAFHIRLTYPDGFKVETVDGRVQLAGEPNLTGSFGFSHFPEGRTYAEKLLDRWSAMESAKPAPRKPGETYAHIAENLIRWQSGPALPLATDAADFRYQLQAPAGIHKKGSWFYTFCVIDHARWPENQFFLDRDFRFSLWNDRAGLIIAGPNTRGNPRGGTFVMARNIDQMVGPLKGGRVENAGDTERVYGRYDGFSSRLVLIPVNDSLFEIRASVKFEDEGRSLRPPHFEAHFFLNFRDGDTIETEGAGRFKLPETYTDFNPVRTGRWIKKGNWSLELPQNSRLIWPYELFTPYSLFGHPGGQKLGVAVLTFPSAGDELICHLKVK